MRNGSFCGKFGQLVPGRLMPEQRGWHPGRRITATGIHGVPRQRAAVGHELELIPLHGKARFAQPEEASSGDHGIGDPPIRMSISRCATLQSWRPAGSSTGRPHTCSGLHSWRCTAATGGPEQDARCEPGRPHAY